MTDQPQTLSIPRSLFIFSLLYGGLVVLAGVLGTKLAAIGPFGSLGTLFVESGIFAFLQLVIIYFLSVHLCYYFFNWLRLRD